MQDKVIENLQKALEGKKIIRLAHTLDEGLDLTVLPELPQEIWYKYPTMGEDCIKSQLEEMGIRCIRPFSNSHRDRHYHYDHLIWKMRADGYLDAMEEEPIFFCYKNSLYLDEACEEYGYRLLMPTHTSFKELQNKNNLEQYGVQPKEGLLPFVEIPVSELSYEKLCAELGSKFVVQFSFSGTGWNTFGSQDTHIISSPNELNKVRENHNDEEVVKASKFINGLPAANIVVNTVRGPLVNAPYLQITGEPHLVDDPKARLLFCGGNYRHGGLISSKAKEQIMNISKNVGEALYKKRYRGIFGLDFMIEDGTDDVYLLEINPRFSGTTMSTNLLNHKQGILPLIALHFAEHLECIPETFNPDVYQKKIGTQEDFAYFFIRPREGKMVQIETAPRIGIYAITSNGVKFVKEAYNFDELPNKDHFLVTRFWPRRRNIPPALFQLCEIWTLEDAFDGVKLNEKYKAVSDAVYDLFSFVPENAYDSSVPYQAV